jgi:hypothetical protein
MKMTLATGTRRWLELALPLYSLALLVVYFRPQYLPQMTGEGAMDSIMPWAIWGVVGALSGVLALSGLFVAFFLLYSPVYLLGKSMMLVGTKGWVDKRELRFYTACFVLLCFLAGLAVWNPVAAAVTFVLLAGCAHFLWRLLV